MLSYRKKVLISDLALLIIFLSLLFPFVDKTVKRIVRSSLEKRTLGIVQKLRSSESLSQMIRYLSNKKHTMFFRVTLVDGHGCVLYDSHIENLFENKSCKQYLQTHPEVQSALKNKIGYEEGFSNLFSQKFAYLAQSFNFQDQTFVLRTAFPQEQLQDLTKNFEFSFLTFGIIILSLFFIMTLLIWHRLTRPIQSILNAIKPYNDGQQKFLPKIELEKKIAPDNDFQQLANTLNSLSEKVQTQIEHLTAQKNENEAILESLIEGVIALDEEEIVTYANLMASKFLKISNKKLIGLSLKECFSQDPALIDLVRKAGSENQILTYPMILHEKENIYLDIIVIPKKKKNGAILVFQDKTTDYKMLQVGKEFIANASHELRTPITIIRGFAETLEEHPRLTPELLKNITEKIVRTCDRLNSLVKSLLTLADLENLPKGNLKKVDLVVVIENCIHLLQSSHPEAQVQFVQQVNRAFVSADRNLLELAIMNLLENAVKYSSSPAEITLNLEKKENKFLLKIEDKGIGIPEGDLEHVFERFYRVDKARSRRHGGAGLGLSIVKTIIEKHQGTVSVYSRINKGSRFTITLPKLQQ